jgi:mRNA-degrading endonuclease toxin of MazEF toxin-antitoxin module
LPVGVEVPPGLSGLHAVSYINLGDIYTVEKIYLSQKLGSVPDIKIKEINKALKYSFDIE